jgi:sulfopyruvate decarboxylase TPP-binding subunit
MIIGERGVLGEFNQVQVPMSRVIRPALDGLGVPYRTLEDAGTLASTTTLVLEQAYETSQPAALIINPLLTGGKQSR